MNAQRCIIFLGPSLTRKDARQILDAEFRAPAAQGDIFRACAEKPAAIGLIDGVFKDTPTVRHREILWAMSQGIPVFGASSMGALRAAELSGCGMIGVGLIYRWYRRFALLPDDAVAVTHGPAALGSPPLSDALVDIRQSLSAARRQGLLTPQAARDHLAKITAQPFGARHVPQAAQPARVSQKAADARALLGQMARHARANDWPSPKTPPPPIIHAWLDDLRDSDLQLEENGQ
jgi:hypothetical protein